MIDPVCLSVLEGLVTPEIARATMSYSPSADNPAGRDLKAVLLSHLPEGQTSNIGPSYASS